MNAKYFEAKVPKPGPYTADDNAILELATQAQRNFQDLFGAMHMSSALEALWELVRGLNKYVDSSAPWVLHKNHDLERLGTVMHTLLTAMRKIATHLWPVMPDTAETMLEQLGCDFDLATVRLSEEAASWSGLEPGRTTASASNLFPRLEPLSSGEGEGKATTKAKGAGSAQANDGVEGIALIDFADFQKVDLRMGTICATEAHPDADKLLRLEIDLGEDKPRQVIAGIAEFYKPAELLDLQVMVVANLAPRKLRGLESHGMLLAVRSKDDLKLVTVMEPVLNGSKVS
jgi:methionyl-tRNA synthetase